MHIRYPDLYKWYINECDQHNIFICKCYLYEGENCEILNLPIKDDPYLPASLDYIEKALEYFCNNYQLYPFESISFPLLGCTNGKLSFDKVKPLMEKYLSTIDKKIYICFGIKQGHRLDAKMLDCLKSLRKEDFSGILDKDGNPISLKINAIKNVSFFQEIRDKKILDLESYKKLYKKSYMHLKVI